MQNYKNQAKTNELLEQLLKTAEKQLQQARLDSQITEGERYITYEYVPDGWYLNLLAN